MTRGGLRENTKVESNHLFKPKWKLGKTVAIRIPEALKDCLLDIARWADNSEIIPDNSLEIYEKIDNYLPLKKRANNYVKQIAELKKENKFLKNIAKDKTKSSVPNSEVNKYKLAVECFGEFVESQNLNMEELYKARKGTKKRQLLEIYAWLNSKADEKSEGGKISA